MILPLCLSSAAWGLLSSSFLGSHCPDVFEDAPCFIHVCGSGTILLVLALPLSSVQSWVSDDQYGIWIDGLDLIPTVQISSQHLSYVLEVFGSDWPLCIFMVYIICLSVQLPLHWPPVVSSIVSVSFWWMLLVVRLVCHVLEFRCTDLSIGSWCFGPQVLFSMLSKLCSCIMPSQVGCYDAWQEFSCCGEPDTTYVVLPLGRSFMIRIVLYRVSQSVYNCC